MLPLAPSPVRICKECVPLTCRTSQARPCPGALLGEGQEGWGSTGGHWGLPGQPEGGEGPLSREPGPGRVYGRAGLTECVCVCVYTLCVCTCLCVYTPYVCVCFCVCVYPIGRLVRVFFNCVFLFKNVC